MLARAHTHTRLQSSRFGVTLVRWTRNGGGGLDVHSAFNTRLARRGHAQARGRRVAQHTSALTRKKQKRTFQRGGKKPTQTKHESGFPLSGMSRAPLVDVWLLPRRQQRHGRRRQVGNEVLKNTSGEISNNKTCSDKRTTQHKTNSAKNAFIRYPTPN